MPESNMSHIFRFRSVADSYLRFEHHIATALFLFGFIFDVFIFSFVDYWTKHALIIFYLSLSGGSILLFHFLKRKEQTPLLCSLLPFVIQFTFGGIMSAMFVYYFRSASVAQSWLFLFTILLMVVGNEFLRQKYHQLVFQISIFFTCLYAFMIVLVPYVQSQIGDFVFIESGLASLLILTMFLFVLSKLNKHAVKEKLRAIMLSISMIVIVLNGLFFTRLIPPIPLVLSDAGIFYSFQKNDDGNYSGIKEPTSHYAHYFPFLNQFHGSGPIFFYSAIFAPASLNTSITHEWQIKNEDDGKWITRLEIHFPIKGGRAGGYRAYSEKDYIDPGKWRVNVLTQNGQSLGSYPFTVLSDNLSSSLSRIRM